MAGGASTTRATCSAPKGVRRAWARAGRGNAPLEHVHSAPELYGRRLGHRTIDCHGERRTMGTSTAQRLRERRRTIAARTAHRRLEELAAKGTETWLPMPYRDRSDRVSLDERAEYRERRDCHRQRYPDYDTDASWG